MQELEKILEEIDIKIAGSMGKKREGLLEAREIIRKHMNEKVTTNDLISRQALLDDFRNTITENSDTFDWLNMIARQPTVNKGDGWIPVEERMPEDGTYICTLDGELCGLEEPFTGMCGIEKGIWDEPDCVIAWRPLPEPYRPEGSDNHDGE